MAVYKKINKKWVVIRNVAFKSSPTINSREVKSVNKIYSGSSYQILDEDKTFISSNYRNLSTKPYHAFDDNINTYWEPGITSEGRWVYSQEEGSYVFIPNISEDEYIILKLDNTDFNLNTLKIICNFDNVLDEDIKLVLSGGNDILNLENITTIYLDPVNTLQEFIIDKHINYSYLMFSFHGRYAKDIKVNSIELFDENGKINIIDEDKKLSFSNAFTGEYGIFWAGRLGNEEEYIDIDMIDSEEVNQLSVYLTDNRPKHFTLYGSNDNENFHTILVAKFDEKKGLQDFLFQTVNYRYYKIKFTSKYGEYYKVNKIFLSKVELNKTWNRFCLLWLKVNGKWYVCNEYIFSGLIREYIDVKLTDATVTLIPLNKINLDNDIHLIETYLNGNVSFLYSSSFNEFLYARNIENEFGDFGYIIETEVSHRLIGELLPTDFIIKDEKDNTFLINSLSMNENKIIFNTSSLHDSKGNITISFISNRLTNEADLPFDNFSISFTPIGLVPTIREAPRVEVIWNE